MNVPARVRALPGGGAPRGWEELWVRDRWRAEELPHGDLESLRGGTLRFDGFAQPWLREAAKRWVRARVLGSTSSETMNRYVQDLSKFSRWLVMQAPQVRSPAQITRALLEDYLLWVRVSDWSGSTRRRMVCALRQFLDEQAVDGLAGLPREAVIHAREIPKVNEPPPRVMAKTVFDQLIDPANLARLACEQHRTIVVVLAFSGLRVSSLVTLSRDPVEVGSDGHPYLRYLNVKLRREATVPIPPAVSEQIRRQQQYLEQTYGPDGTAFFCFLSRPRASGAGLLGVAGTGISRPRA